MMDKSDTLWVMVSTVLVWLMCMPGLALFYGGLARKRHTLSIMCQTLCICALAVILWFLYGYSLAFTQGSALLGGLGRAGLAGLGHAPLPLAGSVPELLFALFQATFAAITCGLIAGSMAERARFGAMLCFTAIWFTVGYLPIAHMVWAADGWLHLRGALDFAGGTVVHISAGVAGLVGARVVGRRVGLGSEPMPPHSLPLNLTGAALLWVGWFGFNAGSALAVNGQAVLALANTLLAAAAGVLAWAGVERLKKGGASLLGAASGAIAGLVGITPAAGFVAPGSAPVIGVLAALAAYYGATSLKRRLGVDDAFDVFGIHAVGGATGAILTGVFYSAIFGGPGPSGFAALAWQVWLQVEAVVVSAVWAAVAALLAGHVADFMFSLRIDVDGERLGLDQAEHRESAYYG
jgi:Amt family ammonium transporter